PELRKVTALIAMPYGGQPQVQVIDAKYTELENIKLIPSKGSIDRNINPEDVPYEFSNTYSVNGWYPAMETLANVSDNFIMRDVAGIALEVVPFQYNAVTETLRVFTEMTVKVQVAGTRNTDPRVSAYVSSEFEMLYQDLFINYTSPFAERNGAVVPEVNKNMMIVTHSSMRDAAQALADWKAVTGYDVTLVNYEDVATDAASLKEFFRSYYDQGNLTFVTLVGDPKHIPFLRGKKENAPSDQDLVRFTDDIFPDAFICRFSARNANEANAMIQKTVKYEREPQTGAEWYKSALAIASNEGNPPDYAYARKLNVALRANLGYNRFFEAYASKYNATGGDDEGFPPFSQNSATKAIVANAVNTGVNIINYIGHGSNTSWGTTYFNNTDVRALQNGMKLPVIWSVACVNGNYTIDECFAEAWQRAGDENGGGSLAIIASTTNMSWVPPIVWQDEIVIEQMSNQKRTQGAVLNLYGMVKTAEQYGTTNYSEGNRLIEQVIFFGEGSTSIRTEAPKAVRAEAVVVDNQILVSVTGESRENLIVTAYDNNVEKTVSGVTDRNGYITLPYEGQTHVTVYGHNIVPVVDIAVK
ncbi:MAG: C25 family cysteine peptidase, partial [Candidatus Muiribacteriota bacterium]